MTPFWTTQHVLKTKQDGNIEAFNYVVCLGTKTAEAPAILPFLYNALAFYVKFESTSA